MKTRLYDSELGRFLSKDQVSGGGSALDFNPYLYCNNNPISRIDPSGKGTTFYFTLPIHHDKPRDTHENEGPVLKLQ